MLWFKNKKNSKSVNIQKKEHQSYTTSESIYEYLYNRGNFDLAAYQAVDYYTKTAPLFTGVDIIASNVASITPVLQNKKTKEYVTDHPFLDLLESPNNDNSYYELIKSAVSFLLITGENYFVSRGLPGSEPKELSVIPPQSINVEVSGDGFISEINSSTPTGQYISFFKANDISTLVKSNRDRYFNVDRTQEIWQIKTFNPRTSYYRVRGLSPFTPLFYSVEQYINADIHNLSLLKKGGRLSGVFIFENELTEENYTRLKEQINDHYAGAENAGRIALLEGEKVSYEELGASNKDMDFVALKDAVETAIYNLLRIPLPLVKAAQMTLTNLPAAKLILYHDAILPMAKRIFAELTLMNMYRYKNSEDLMLTFRQQDIPALQSEIIAELTQISALGVISMDEVRAELGRNELIGGKDIYRPATSIPVASTKE